MAKARHNDIRPDFIGNDLHIILFIKRYGFLKLGNFPHSPRGIMRRAENRSVDFFLLQLPFHILKVYPPNPLFITVQGTGNDGIAVIYKASCKSDIGRGMQKDLIPFRAENTQRGKKTPENPIFIGNVFRKETLYPVLRFLPVHNPFIIFLTRLKIAEAGMHDSIRHGFLNAGCRRKVHIRNPHRNRIKALFRCFGCSRQLPDSVNCCRILPLPIYNTCKVEFHRLLLSLFPLISI